MTVAWNHIDDFYRFVVFVVVYFSLDYGFVCFLSRVLCLFFSLQFESLISVSAWCFVVVGGRGYDIFLSCSDHGKFSFRLQLWQTVLLGPVV